MDDKGGPEATAEGEIRCPHCGQALPPGSAKCFRCGTWFVEGDERLPYMFPDDGDPADLGAEDEEGGESGRPWWQFWRSSS
jgi:DNA-directed RNA polymerase subunit RPC12/RpoP